MSDIEHEKTRQLGNRNELRFIQVWHENTHETLHGVFV